MNAVVYSVWKCRGNWFERTWAVVGSKVIDGPINYRGAKTEQKALDSAKAAVAQVKTDHPELADLPVVRENSNEWNALKSATKS